ncbi:MAG: NAD(P)H-dependent oxidoreductase [Crocinitomicaceae bacterium]|nr:NAD(P)H-dependent oxidoreductase [Crocinitomicaceae bacterium]
MKNIVIINGHPDKKSYNSALAQTYYDGAKQGSPAVKILNIADFDFNPNLQFGYRQRTKLEPDLLNAIDLIKKADHIVWVFPMWWSGLPAILKGFIDRTFLPGITYQPVENKNVPEKLLKGKTARIIMTSDSPKWYDRYFNGRPAINQLKQGTLKFCGIKSVKVTYIATIKNSSQEFRSKWLNRVLELGKNLK